MESRPRLRRRVEPTDEWEQIELLCGWPEQRDYELIRPLVLFGAPADGRSQETGASSGRTLRRKAASICPAIHTRPPAPHPRPALRRGGATGRGGADLGATKAYCP